jgi:hypothetical protein
LVTVTTIERPDADALAQARRLRAELSMQWSFWVARCAVDNLRHFEVQHDLTPLFDDFSAAALELEMEALEYRARQAGLYEADELYVLASSMCIDRGGDGDYQHAF